MLPISGKSCLELLLTLLGSLIILSCRIFLEKYVFAPIGTWYGLKGSERKKPNFNPILEAAYRRSNKFTENEILGLSKQTDLSEADIQEWLRLKSAENKVTDLDKFCESCWKLFYYCFRSTFGLIVLWNKPWFLDIELCWSDLSNQVITYDVWCYFMLLLSCTWFQLIYDAKKKDFYLMVVHHLTLIIMISFNLTHNIYRITFLALYVSNLTDVTLQVFKMAIYLGYQKIAKWAFIIFVASWTICRFVLLPFWIIKSVVMDSPKFISSHYTYGIYLTLIGFSSIFMILNIIWSYFVTKAAARLLTTGTISQDTRSDCDE